MTPDQMTTNPGIPNPPLSVLGRKIAFSTLIQYAGKIVQIVLAAVTIKIISNFLSQQNYGVYGTIIEYALFFSVIANLGIFANIVRKMADAPNDGKVFINALVLRILTAVIFFIPGILILIVTGSDQIFLMGTILVLGALFFDYVTSVCDGMLQANYLMGRATFALVAGRVVSLIGVLLIVRKFVVPELASLAGEVCTACVQDGSFTLLFLFLATVAGAFVTAALSLYFVRRKIQWSWNFDVDLMWSILKISIPFGIINVINNLYFRFLPDYFAHLHLSDEQFATFTISFRIAQVMSLFSTFLMFSVLPGFKEYIDQKHWKKAHVLYRKVWKILVASGIALVFFGSIFGSTVIEILTHKKYFLPEFWFVLPLMLLLAAISYGYDLILITLFAVEKDWWLVKRELIALTVSFMFFGASFLVTEVTTKLLLIILAAIAGESVMVILGMLKTRKVFAGHD